VSGAQDLRGRPVIVTSASSGIGAATARALHAADAHPVLAARRAQRLEALRAELGGALSVQADPTGVSAFFLIIAWILGGYIGATVLAVMLGGPRSPGLRTALLRLGLLAAYAAMSGLLGALLIGPALGVVAGYNAALAGLGIVVVFAAAAATAGLQAALGMPGTLLAIIAMVVFGDPTAGTSIATALLASPWNVIGQGLPPSAGLTAARSILYLGGVNLTGPLTVLAVYAAAGTLLVLAAAAWRQHRPAGPAAAGQPA
jgi:NAD(P)-dependent dehydrogenase (short-subunit alcohol dehydrogenase family)